MIIKNTYRESDKMSDLICSNYSLLQVLSRFQIPMGFGNKTVREVCLDQGIDVSTFLCVANFMLLREPHLVEHPSVNLRDLLNYLKQAHNYFIEFNLPTIRRKLVESLEGTADKMVVLSVLNFFDEYANEVRKHMEYENRSIFSYIEKLIDGVKPSDYSISKFAEQHKAIDYQHVEAKLTELKNIIIKYFAQPEVNYLLNSVLADIFASEEELAKHCYLEDYILVPAVMALENSYNHE